MASDFSFDIVCQFDLQELKNALDQTRKEISNRFDLKDAKIVIELSDNEITLNVKEEFQFSQVMSVLMQKVVNRGLSPKILDPKEPESAADMRYKQSIKLIKSLDQENAKNISKFIRDNFPKVKPNINADTVRVSSKDKDELQAVMQALRTKEDIKIPIQFTNYR